uniref:Uncharacterized protein n=1 Tax=Amphimedon queenslandica TaxID=400682 RepID=A0A1X7VWG0_AMPQE
MVTSLLLAIPTFGDLIDLLEEAEDLSAPSGKSVSEVLYSLFRIRYPHVTVGRPQRLYDAAKRVAGPTRSSLRRASKLSGSSLSLYRAKEWLPQSRTQLESSSEGTGPLFPIRLLSYGLNEELLAKVYDQVQNDKIPSCNVAIGKFYIVIDLNLRNKGLRPDNAYKFVDRLVSSKCSCDSIVKYGLDADANLQTQVKECMKFTQMLITVLEKVKRQRDEAEKKLSSTQVTLKEALDEVKRTAKCARVAEKKVLALQKLNECRLADLNCLIEKFEEVEKQNFEMSEILTLVQNKLATVTDATSITFNESTMSFTLETKCNGKQYSRTIRKL